MDKILIIASLFSLMLISNCTQEKTKTPAPQTNAQAPQTTPDQTDNQGYAAKPNPIGDSKYANILVAGYWVFEKYYHPEKPKKALGKGRWFKFEKDGSFVSGRWEEQTASGSWRLYSREGKQFILLDSTNNSEDAEFDIQGINGDGDIMAWVGTPAYAAYDPVSLTIMNLLTIPTKAQFGVQ
jgi:hypothetical protein